MRKWFDEKKSLRTAYRLNIETPAIMIWKISGYLMKLSINFHIMFPVGFFTLPAGIVYVTRRNGQFCHGIDVIHAFDVHVRFGSWFID